MSPCSLPVARRLSKVSASPALLRSTGPRNPAGARAEMPTDRDDGDGDGEEEEDWESCFVYCMYVHVCMNVFKICVHVMGSGVSRLYMLSYII